jgi:hypothetical protein
LLRWAGLLSQVDELRNQLRDELADALVSASPEDEK